MDAEVSFRAASLFGRSSLFDLSEGACGVISG